MNIKVSVFTPTYNRAHTLRRCYESILQQTDIEKIEWILINDGSTDNTDEIVDNFISEGRLNITYIKQKNQGKQFTWNRAISLAKGELFIGLDSDDIFQPFSLFEIINSNLEKLNSTNIVGLRCLAVDSLTMQVSGRAIKNESIELSWFDEFSNKDNFGERIDILKTNLIKNFLYPVTPNIRFIPEIWFYTRIADAGYKFLYIPEALSLFYNEETQNRLSRSSILGNAEGHYISRTTMLRLIPNKVWLSNPTALLKTIIRFSQVAKYLNKSFNDRKEKTNLYFTILSYILSLFLLRV